MIRRSGFDHDDNQIAPERRRVGRALQGVGRADCQEPLYALWLLSRGHEIDEVAELLSFSTRWVRILIKRYNECGP